MACLTTMSRIWIEQHFQKRECVRFISSSKDPSRCGCGQTLSAHTSHGNHDLYRAYSVHSHTSSQTSTEEHWNPFRHTAGSPTDAFGTIQFQGSGHPLKAQYVRLSYDTKPEAVLQLFTKEWQLELPKLLITVHGGKANFNLQSKLKKVLSKGLVNAAKTTGAWIFTAGTNTGVMRHVGDALLNERTPCLRGKVVAIGIAPWGIIENRKELIGKNMVVRYHSISCPKSRLTVLNNHHSYFILVDNGTVGRYGGEIALRKKLEKYLSKQKIYPRTEMESCGVPVVCVVVEGGLNTIRTVLEYVTDTPPVPVVVCDGSGRAADLIAFAHKYTQDDDTLLESVKEQLLLTVEKTFNLNGEQAEQLFHELMRCVRRKDLITVFRMGEGPCQELDQAVLTALLKGHRLAPPDQLRLALTWNRVDIARSEIFVYGQEWLPGALYQAMMDALVMNNVDFVKLLLENGVNMQKFLTIPRLEELYNSKHGPTNTLQYLVRDVRKNVSRQYRYTLYDIGLVIERLMGGAYLSSYCRRKFRHLYNNVMRRVVTVSTSPTMCVQHTVGPPTDAMRFSETMFSYPFNELLIWAVLTKRHKMALFMWQSGEEAIVKALVACNLYKAMAQEAAQDDMEADIYEEMMVYAREFEKLALELLDYCYCHDDDSTLQLLTYELQNWNKQTCLGLAMAAKHGSFLAHTASQMLVADLWMGGLRTRKNTNLKVILGLLFPPTILTLEFKSKEELKLMPQTEEEHYLNLEDRDDDDFSENKEHVVHEETNVLEENFENEAYVNTCSPYSYTPISRIENGKVSTFDSSPASVPRIKHHPIRLGKRVYQFYGAPITKFWGHTIAYGVFLVLFTYIVLVRMSAQPSWQEAYVIAYLSTLGIEKVREIITSEPMGFSQKLAVWLEKKWNPCDFVVIIFFFAGVSLRLLPVTQDVGRVIYCLNIMYWYIRILDILSVNKHLGPYVTMIGKMVIDMIYFVVLLLVVLMSYGVARQAILYPNKEPSWYLVRDIFYLPYFMLYGEVFADSINPECGEESGLGSCQTGRWINPAIMAIYLLIANILLVNLLIAVFNNIFFEVNAVSQQVWKSQRFRVVIDYAQKPVLPPPLIIISHIHQFLKCCFRRWHGKSETLDHGLKLFLSAHDVDRIHDFEEECVEGYFREKETQVQMSTDEQIRNTAERVELMAQKVDDIYQRQKEINTGINNLHYEMSKIESVLTETASCLPVIQDFVASYIEDHSSLQPLDVDSEEEEDEKEEEAFHSVKVPYVPPPPIVSVHIEKDSDEMAGGDEEPEITKEASPSKVSFLDVEIPHHSFVSPLPDSHKSSGGNLLHRRMQKRRQDLPCLMRQITVAAPEALEHSLPDESTAGKIAPQSACSLQRGVSIADVDDQLPQPPHPRRMKIERSYSCASHARWNRQDPFVRVVPPSPRPRLASTRGEYTSITDELELVAQTRQLRSSLSSPTPSSHQFPPSITVSRQGSAEQENVLMMETEVLRDAEEEDYHVMAGLIHRRLHRDSENLTVSLEDLCSGNTDSESDDGGTSDGQHSKASNKTPQPSISPSPSAPDMALKCLLEPSTHTHPPKSLSAHSLLPAHSVFRNETSC